AGRARGRVVVGGGHGGARRSDGSMVGTGAPGGTGWGWTIAPTVRVAAGSAAAGPPAPRPPEVGGAAAGGAAGTGGAPAPGPPAGGGAGRAGAGGPPRARDP